MLSDNHIFLGGFVFLGFYCQEVPRRNDHSLLLYTLCSNPSCGFLSHCWKKYKRMETVDNGWSACHYLHGKDEYWEFNIEILYSNIHIWNDNYWSFKAVSGDIRECFPDRCSHMVLTQEGTYLCGNVQAIGDGCCSGPDSHFPWKHSFSGQV